MAPVEIPKNIDFVFQSKFKRLKVENLDLRDAQGTIKVSGGIMRLNGFNFSTLGGKFAATGTYDSRDIARPAFDFDFNIKNLSVGKAAANFNTFAAFAPVAQNLEGDFNTNFNLKGLLGQDMMPMMESLTGGGGVNLLSADLKNMKIFDQISALTGLDNLNQYSLKDVDLAAEVKDGNLIIKPFDVKMGDYAANISGITSHDGKIQYLIKMDIPKAKMNSKISSALNMFGGETAAAETVQMNFNIGGTYTAPKVSPAGGGTQDLVKDAVKERIASEKQAVKDSSVSLIKDILTDTTGKQKPTEKVTDAISKWKDRFGFGKKKEEAKPDTTKVGGN